MQSIDTYRHFIMQQPEFNQFSREEREALFQKLQVKTFPKGQVLFDYGDIRDRFFYILKGAVRLERLDRTGNFTFINYVKSKTAFPYRELYTNSDYPYTAVALMPITIAMMPMSLFEQHAVNNPGVAKQVIQQMSQLLDRTENRLQKMVTSSAANRVRQALIIFGTDLGEQLADGSVKIPYPITLIELARISGTSRETAGQVVTKLLVENKISYEKKRFQFNPADLAI